MPFSREDPVQAQIDAYMLDGHISVEGHELASELHGRLTDIIIGIRDKADAVCAFPGDDLMEVEVGQFQLDEARQECGYAFQIPDNLAAGILGGVIGILFNATQKTLDRLREQGQERLDDELWDIGS